MKHRVHVLTISIAFACLMMLATYKLSRRYKCRDQYRPMIDNISFVSSTRSSNSIWPLTSLEKCHNSNSVGGHTGSGIPVLFRNMLTNHAFINEHAETSYGAEEAVIKLQAVCAWDQANGAFGNSSCISNYVPFQTEEHIFAEDTVDIVIPSIRDLDFLDEWREHLEGRHFILIQDGDPSKILNIPTWLDFELYNHDDIKKSLGEDAWIISSKDASIRNFGFLVSKAKYIYTLDDDCRPISKDSNALKKHVLNLQRNSTPYFFNTLYDPYHPGADFVRGYPYSLRDGVPTVISHGLWLHAPDYDAPTQLLKINERNERLVDMTLTIPHRVLYPMCSMNVAFDRELIGPAFMQGLMGEGMPWARYDDMFAGWASKVVADHLNYGVKSGQPYIRHIKASNPFTNLMKEYKGLFWQEELILFFSNIQLEGTNAAEAYVDLSKQLETRFGTLHPYFTRLAEAMRVWVRVWGQAAQGKITWHPSRRSFSYAERYQLCTIPKFDLTARLREEAVEMVILRMGKNGPWGEDYTKSVCAMLTETCAKRAVYLLVMHDRIQFVPEDFLQWVVPMNDSHVRESNPSFVNGLFHGDMAVSVLMSEHLNHPRAWVMEDDCRLVGDWGDFFDSASTMSGDADLVTWKGKYLKNELFNTGHWWHQRQNFHGAWAATTPTLRGMWTMGFGMSQLLASALIRLGREGTFNDNQEVNLPTATFESGLRFFEMPPFPAMEWECCDIGSAQGMYNTWMNDPHARLPQQFLMHAVKL
jgi:reversibly glycosylated polypeptide / UDP-arabinopyranose mutase